MPTVEQDDGFPIIQTERLILRLADPFNSADGEKVIRLYNLPGVAQSAVSSIKTIADVQEKFRRHGPRQEYCTLAPAPRGMYFMAFLPAATTGSNEANRQEGDFVGQIHLSFRPEIPYPDLGYGIFPDYEGYGYATEAAKAVVQFWRETIGVDEIFIGTSPTNTKSQKLAERLGFVWAGNFNVMFGHPPNETTKDDGQAYILPHMKWQEGLMMKLTIGAEAQAPPE